MSRLFLWIVFARWVLVSTARDIRGEYQLEYKRQRDSKVFYLALVQNNFCGARSSEFIRRDMLRILNIQEELNG